MRIVLSLWLVCVSKGVVCTGRSLLTICYRRNKLLKTIETSKATTCVEGGGWGGSKGYMGHRLQGLLRGNI